MSEEGYLLLATGPAKYVEMARNLAASIRVMDGTRRICLVHDENAELGPQDRKLFDDFSVLEDHPLYPGFMNKIRLFKTSPYQRAMFVDVDCLLMKRDIDAYWEMMRPYPFAITGGRRTSGEWKGADIARLLQQEGAPYLVQMNSGVFSFDQSPAAAQFFEGLNDYYLRRREHLGVGLHRGKPAQTDEIYIGLWMGLNGLDSCNGRIGDASLMVSTWRAFGMRFDPAHGISVIRKPRRSIAGIPTPIFGWDRISPTFVHFIGLKPRRQYDRLARYFRQACAA
ncbi:glycosyltransferase family protein [Roseomonas marmotae]|uniref:Nucleotide-diphospho-sugar transferase domain-containing protein n=1 Tax=Roseomonas marmotae TaxID=2768161 RepID=A0ABS3K7T7_9PROT|nr:hypothetical protein [Roseomonas marmotae]MBO1073527.1 hypothetical protein [Roseomonas marmotae]QTI80285.1 hypothetical protein IAI58_05920 [Roseomonas marmotae]